MSRPLKIKYEGAVIKIWEGGDSTFKTLPRSIQIEDDTDVADMAKKHIHHAHRARKVATCENLAQVKWSNNSMKRYEC